MVRGVADALPAWIGYRCAHMNSWKRAFGRVIHQLQVRDRLRIRTATVLLLALPALSRLNADGQISITPTQMKPLADVDPRFVSYNVEAVEVTGGRFWAPYKYLPASGGATAFSGVTSGSIDSRFRYRAPIDLYNPKLRKLAAALAPAYVRVSGSWRNSTYFQDDDLPVMKTPPPGFLNVMTRAQWKSVVDFAKAVDGAIVASVTTSAGTHDAEGIWTTDQAKRWLDYTASVGGHIAATEYMNEPTIMNMTGVAGTYGPKEYGRDSRIFQDLLKKESPSTLYLGPSGAAEADGDGLGMELLKGRITPSATLMAETGPIFDGFSYHVYYAMSHRCAGDRGTDPKSLLTSEYFKRGQRANAFFADVRDKSLPGKPLWLTETGEASCGGDTWAAEFVDTFRLLDQYGFLAQKGVRSVMYNTLASSDYGMLDEETYEPRPNYWASVLWKRTMGTRSLDPALAQTEDLRSYAQCMKGMPGGVAILLMNVSNTRSVTLKLPMGGTRYTLTSPDLFSKTVLLNGQELRTGEDGAVPAFTGEEFKKGALQFKPLSITVITMADAHNLNCSVR